MFASSSSRQLAGRAARTPTRLLNCKTPSSRALHFTARTPETSRIRVPLCSSHDVHRHRRSISTTPISRAALASRPPAERTELVYHPTPESLQALESEDDDVDIDLIPLEEAQLEITERAAEQLRSIAKRENDANAGLRIAVESGGCHGYQYKMELTKERKPDDYHFSHPTVKPSNILVDAVSMSLMKGSVIDFATELIGSSFRIAENPQAKGSGCGCGVSWELKV